MPLAGLVDTAMLGHLADLSQLAGAALAAVIFDTIYWSTGFLRMATAGLTAQAVGAADRVETHRTLHRALTLALAIAAGLLLLQWPLRELGFLALGGTAGVESAGRDYFDARIWGAPATLVNFAAIGWLLGRERSGSVLWMTLTANVTNVAFNWLLIVRLGLGARGAGLATMLSQYAMLLVAVAIWARLGEREPWSMRAVLDRAALARLFRLNRDIFLRTFLLVACFASFTNFSSLLGTVALAANTILLRLFYLAAYAIDGAALATESLSGIFRGARDLPRLRRLIRLALWTGLAFGGVYLATFFAAPLGWLRLLTDHEDVVRYAAWFSPWLVPVLALGSLAFVYDGVFIGLTEARALRNSMLISAAGVYLPIALVATRLGSNQGLWLALAALMAARALTLGLACRNLLREYRTWVPG